MMMRDADLVISSESLSVKNSDRKGSRRDLHILQRSIIVIAAADVVGFISLSVQ